MNITAIWKLHLSGLCLETYCRFMYIAILENKITRSLIFKKVYWITTNAITQIIYIAKPQKSNFSYLEEEINI